MAPTRPVQPHVVALSLFLSLIAACSDTPDKQSKCPPILGCPEGDGDATGDGDGDNNTGDGDGDNNNGDGSAGDGDNDSDAGDGDASTPNIDPRDPVEVIPTKDPADLGLPTIPDNAPGDLLISRTGRGCLSVDPGASLAAGSPVMLGVCRGLTGQRWTAASAGISLADAPELCLDATSGKFKLSACSSITQFKLAADGVIERGSTAADVTSDGELISYGTHRNENQQWSLLSEDLEFIEDNKSHAVSYPLPATDTLGYQLEEARHRVGMVQPPYPLAAERDVSTFPGNVGASEPMISRRVHLNTTFDYDTGYLRVSWAPKHWQSTGVYAPAGKVLVLELPANATAGIFVRINGHTDSLSPTSGNVSGGEFERMPRVSMRVALLPGKNAVRSPYGGEVILESEQDQGLVKIDIHGGVEQPRFVRGVTSDEEWTRRRALNVPWAELEGDHSVITVPSAQIKSLTTPGAVMEKYDRVVELEMDLFGLDKNATSGVHRPYQGKPRWMSDVQITAGYGHSGFPIMVVHDWKLADTKEGPDSWGVWHELGHNHQQFCLWSTRFGTEVTNNLYSLYVQTEGFQHEERIADDYAPMIADLEDGVVQWDDLNDPWNELVFLMQPVHAFPDIGWDIYRRVQRAYRELPADQRDDVCDSQALQVDTFYEFLSAAAEADLRGHFARWGFTVSQAARDRVAAKGLEEPPVEVWRAKP